MNGLIWNQHFKKILDGRPAGFEGRYYNKNPAITWKNYIPLTNSPINYLEIGVADGGNAIHIANSYCSHPDSKIYCVDPWSDYDEYPEYKGKQDLAWDTVRRNIANSGHLSKFIINRGFSSEIVPTFEDNFFDIILVDGNHETEFVYSDGCMAFQKVKHGGYIVFDDYDLYAGYWPQTKKGVDMFIDEYSNKLRIITKDTYIQLIVQKI